MQRKFTAIIEREDDGYVALCPELDIASQGDSIADARTLRSIIRHCGLPRDLFEVDYSGHDSCILPATSSRT